MKITQVLETDNCYFKIDDLIKIQYKTFDDEYNQIGTEEIEGRIKQFSNNNTITLDISKVYESKNKSINIYDIINIGKIGFDFNKPHFY